MKKPNEADHAAAHSGRRDAEAVSSDEAKLPANGKRNPVKPQVEDASKKCMKQKDGSGA